MKRINPPYVNAWMLDGYPDVIWVTVNYVNHRFKKARWKQAYPGVVEQYRQDVPRDSMHLFVRADGMFEINHVDSDNPDHGRVVEHVMNDTPVGPIMAGAAVLGGVMLLTSAVAAMIDE